MKTHTMRMAVIAGAMAIAGTAQAEMVLQTYDLYNHPSGAVDPQAYGLRLDGVADSGENMTFSFENAGQSSVRLQVLANDNDPVDFFIRITGTVYGNSASSDPLRAFNLDVFYNVSATANGWTATTGADPNAIIGSITGDFDDNGVADDAPVDLFATHNNSGLQFAFLSDGYRITGDSSTWVGRGWVLPNGQAGSTNDFLFVANLVPLPPAAIGGLAMLGGLVVARRLRK